ncbi:MAG: DUF4240 domain-containing protein [Terrabacter sp.]
MRLLRRAMREDEFWDLIDLMEGEADEAAVARLGSALEQAGKRRARAFQERLATVLHDLDREVLATQPVRFEDEDEDDELIPLSDDTFLYLRAGIVTRGRDVVASVIAQPDLLAAGRWPECEELLYVAEEVVDDDIDTKVSYESASNEAHWSPRESGPEPGWSPPAVLVEGHDLDEPLEGERVGADGSTEPLVAFMPPSYLPLQAFFDASHAVDDVVKRHGGIPEDFGAPVLLAAVEFAAEAGEPTVGPGRSDLFDEDVIRSSVRVTHVEARAWPKSERRSRILALAAQATLQGLPAGHPARPELEALAGATETSG